MTRQLVLEKAMQDSGVAKFFATVQRAKNSPYDGESVTSYGLSMLRYYVDSLAWIIQESIKKNKGKPGKTAVAWEYLDGKDYRTVAYLTAKTVIDVISKTVPLTSTAIKIAGKIEDNLRLEILRGYDRKYMDSTQKYIKDHRKFDRPIMRNLLLSSFDKSEKTPDWNPWPMKHRVHIGVALIQCFISATSDRNNEGYPIPGTGLVQVTSDWKNGQASQYFLIGTAKAVTWIRTNQDVSKDMHPDFWPCVERPVPWISPDSGGYHSRYMQDKKPLVKCQRRKYLKDMPEDDQAPLFYKAVNVLQDVPYELNTTVYNCIQREFKRKDGVGMPAIEPVVIPRNPLTPIDTKGLNKEQARKAKTKARKKLKPHERQAYAEWHADYLRLSFEERVRVTKCLQVARTLAMASRMQNENEIYSVWSADFRGRLYAACTALSVQGTDFSKACLKFRNGLRLGEHGFKHLCLTAASHYGVDKVSLDDRLKWVQDNTQAFIQTYIDPDRTREFWGAADEPYQFLAVAIEIGECIQLSTTERQDYVSYVPCPQDGKCNGIQHFSAMLCDTTSAQAVCLSDSEIPNDIYQDTAYKVLEYLNRTIENYSTGYGFKMENKGWGPCGKMDMDIAKAWLEFGVCRKLTKKPTMVLPYGGTKIACRDQVAEYIAEKIAENKLNDPDYVHPFTGLCTPVTPKGTPLDPIRYASAFLTNYVWAALDEVVVASRKAMKFLQDIAGVINKHDPGVISWVTPTGFRVKTDIRDTKNTLIKTFLDGQIQLSFQEEMDSMNKYRMRSSIAPNFVHSIDSSHLQLCVCAAHDIGIKDITCVHDLMGTHAGNTELFNKIIRGTFRELHRDNLLVEFWRQQVKQRPHLKELFPNSSDVTRGDFDLDQVMTSRHFFG